ncbi:MAG: NAD(P)H-dependent glycerol-3-phosphate dehydrogenase [Oligoflexia bacterium]|nr:NAD(P)H-dependent glycerol-3-phosphate dehydrogenase [Oligoflexia bacterium]
MSRKGQQIHIVGKGQFGRALGRHFKAFGHRVAFYGRSNLHSISIKRGDIIVLAIPAQSFPDIAQVIPKMLRARAVISAAKGLIRGINQTTSQYLNSKGLRRVAVLSGPSFAREINQGKPTALVIASTSRALSAELAHKLSTSQLRLYINTDPLGVEMSGALKNVYAIGAGIAMGLDLGQNALASFISRSLAEMSAVSLASGAKRKTVFGLAGVGDLILTCTSTKSRNFRFGMGLAKGKTQKHLMRRLGTLEGYWTLAPALNVVNKLKIETPILHAISSVVLGGRAPLKLIESLMKRTLRHEF